MAPKRATKAPKKTTAAPTKTTEVTSNTTKQASKVTKPKAKPPKKTTTTSKPTTNAPKNTTKAPTQPVTQKKPTAARRPTKKNTSKPVDLDPEYTKQVKSLMKKNLAELIAEADRRMIKRNDDETTKAAIASRIARYDSAKASAPPPPKKPQRKPAAKKDLSAQEKRTARRTAQAPLTPSPPPAGPGRKRSHDDFSSDSDPAASPPSSPKRQQTSRNTMLDIKSARNVWRMTVLEGKVKKWHWSTPKEQKRAKQLRKELLGYIEANTDPSLIISSGVLEHLLYLANDNLSVWKNDANKATFFRQGLKEAEEYVRREGLSGDVYRDDRK